MVQLHRIKREMEGKYIEEKKKIWKKSISQETRERQNKKKIWKKERAFARSVPIFEEQRSIEYDIAQAAINQDYDPYYTCNCKKLMYGKSCINSSAICYNCEGRLHMTIDLKEKEEKSMHTNVVSMHPWGIVKVKAEYYVPPISLKLQNKYKKDYKKRLEIWQRSTWFSQNNIQIMKSIRLVKNKDMQIKREGVKIWMGLTNDSEKLKKFYLYCYFNYDNIMRNPLFLLGV